MKWLILWGKKKLIESTAVSVLSYDEDSALPDIKKIILYFKTDPHYGKQYMNCILTVTAIFPLKHLKCYFPLIEKTIGFTIFFLFVSSVASLETCCFNEIGKRMHCLNEQFTTLSLFKRFAYTAYNISMQKNNNNNQIGTSFAILCSFCI